MAPLQLLTAAFHSFHRWLSANIQLNQLFRQVCLKDLHCDQHRRMTVADEYGSTTEYGECLGPGFGQVVGPVTVHKRFFMNIQEVDA